MKGFEKKKDDPDPWPKHKHSAETRGADRVKKRDESEAVGPIVRSGWALRR